VHRLRPFVVGGVGGVEGELQLTGSCSLRLLPAAFLLDHAEEGVDARAYVECGLCGAEAHCAGIGLQLLVGREARKACVQAAACAIVAAITSWLPRSRFSNWSTLVAESTSRPCTSATGGAW